MTRLTRILAAALVAAAPAACAEPLDPSAADLTGTVVTRSEPGKPPTIGIQTADKFLLVGPPSPDRIVHVDGPILARRGTFGIISIDQVTIGSRVAIWTTGAELRSMPAQVVATRILLLDR